MSSFQVLGVSAEIIRAIEELNIITPTKIQSETIPMLLAGDVHFVAQAQTGTGKTAAYGLPIVQKIRPEQKAIQALVLCPTRELAQQVAKQFFKFTKYLDQRVFVESVYGGAKIDIQIDALKRPTHILVATPGRLIDLLKRKAVNLDAVNMLVLDEADEMLSMGFKKELDSILNDLPRVPNKWLFSATIPDGIRHIVNTHLEPDATHIQVDKGDVVNKNIEHQFVVCDTHEKLPLLVQFLKGQKNNRGVVFCRTKASVGMLERQLQERNISAAGIQGDLLQKERDKVMRAFKNEKVQVLVATDLAARGLDIDSLAYVAHYELPDNESYYTHRSGRTARAGKEGVSLSFVTSAEVKQLRYFEKKLQIGFNQIRRS